MRDVRLVVNTADARVQMALFSPEADKAPQILCQQDWFAPSRGTEVLPEAFSVMMTLLKLPATALTHIACVNGPGSFTGIRLGLSFTGAVRRVCGAQMAGINIMQALAMEAPAPAAGAEGIVRVLTHARRGLVYLQDFLLRGAAFPAPASAQMVVQTADAASGLDAYSEKGIPVSVLGSGVSKNFEVLKTAFASRASLMPGVGETPGLASLIALAMVAEYTAEDPLPVYLRPCDAVDNLPHIAEMRGDDAATLATDLDSLLRHKPESFDF